jgi:LCP family protein required for cell wall assembly
VALIAVTVVSTLLLAATLYGLLLVARIHHVKISFPAPGVGTTYVIAGSDQVPASTTALGRRADAVLIIHEFGFRTTVLAVPRNLLVSPAGGTSEPLALTLQQGPQALVDGLCHTLGVAATRLVLVNFSGFSSIVNSLGGVDVTMPYPVRDPATALQVTQTGTAHLDGAQAVALIRADQPQWLVHGRWVAVPSSSLLVTGWTAQIMNSLVDSAKDHLSDPWAMQRLVWTATGSLTVSQNTGVFDLIDTAHRHGEAAALPTGDVGGSQTSRVDASTRSALAAAGYRGTCTSSKPR